MLKMILMVVIVVEMMSTNSTAKFVIALKCQRQLKPQMDPIVRFHIGLVTTFVMMKTTMLNVDLMVETVVETLSTLATAPNVNVLMTSQQLLKTQAFVVLHNGSVITTAMMTTTMQGVVLMVETVAETMSTLPTAPNVHVLKCQKQLNHPWNQLQNHLWMNVKLHNGLATTIVMTETTILDVDLMEVIAAM